MITKSSFARYRVLYFPEKRVVIVVIIVIVVCSRTLDVILITQHLLHKHLKYLIDDDHLPNYHKKSFFQKNVPTELHKINSSKYMFR